MPTYVVIARDYPDAHERRLHVRAAHVAVIDEYKALGNMQYGAAILNDKGDMAGSVICCTFEDRVALDNWLAHEPYVTGKVWEKVEVLETRLGPSFASEVK